MVRLLVVSTCGTSLLTNGACPEDRSWLTKIANEPYVDEARLMPIAENRSKRLATADDAERRSMSAEINGIGAVLDRYKPNQVFHILVHTDTALGRVSSELVQSCLGGQSTLMSSGGLRSDHLASFRVALADLTKQIDQVVREYRDQGWFVIFNLTGGFKSLNGYLQTLGMILADRCVFLFEGAPELMEIPRLPVRLSEVDDLREHIVIFRRLAVGYEMDAASAGDVPETLLMEYEGKVTTSVLGDVAWTRCRDALLAERLLEPLSTKVRIADAVRKAFASLETNQKVQVNEAIDEFCAYTDGVRPLTKSRTFKKLQGDPVPSSTHELYAWSSGATGRLFGHYAGDGTFCFDALSGHL